MKKLLSLLAIASLVLTGCGGGNSGDTSDKTYKIGVLQMMTHDALDAAYEGFKDGLEEEGITAEFDYQNGEGEQGTLVQMSQQLVSNNPDLILSIGTPATQALQGETTEIPIVGTAITDYVETKLVASNEAPGGNITGTSDGCPMDAQIDLLQKLVPDCKTVGIIYTSSEQNSEIQAKQAQEEWEGRGLKVIVKTVSGKNEINDTMESFVGKVEAIYVPTDNNIASAMASVDLVATPNKIVTIVGCNTMCGDGGTASMGVDYYKLGKQTATQAAKILRGEATPAEMPIETLTDLDYYYNSDILNRLGLEWPSDLTGTDYYGYKDNQ